MERFVRFFIDQRRVINMIAVVLTLSGAFVFWFGQREAFPNINFDVVVVRAFYPGASPKEVETLVTDKIEDALESVDGAKRTFSSSSEGRSILSFEIDPDYSEDVDQVVNDIRSAVDTINDFPEDVEDPIIQEINSDVYPVLSVVVTGPSDDFPRLRATADRVEDDLKDIQGVSKITKTGYLDKEIWVEADPEKMEQRDLSLSDVVQAIKKRNINLPGGKIRIEGEEYLIRTLGQYEKIEEISNTIVRGNDSGKVVYVKDIAKVSWQYEIPDTYTRAQGKNGIVLKVLKKKSGDIIRVADGVKAYIKQSNEKYEKEGTGFRLFYSDDFSFFVKRRLSVLSSNAFFGGVLIFFCLIIFFNWKVTLWTAVGIPIAFCMSMLVVSNFGITLNLMSMFGFIIVIGMIVDDAIIVAENIYRHMEEGMPLAQAAVTGTAEVIRPVAATVATTIAAFLPLVLLSGVIGQFLRVVPVVVIVTMVASFIECLFVLPGHLASGRQSQKTKGKARQIESTRFYRFQQQFGRLVAYMLSHPKKLITFFMAYSILAGLFFIFQMPKIFFPGGIDEYTVEIETHRYNSLDQTSVVIDEVERRLRKAVGSETREFISTTGYWIEDDSNDQTIRTHIGSIRVILDPDRKSTDDEVFEMMNEATASVPGVMKKNIRKRQGGPPQEKPINVKIFGNSFSSLKKASEEVKEMIAGTSNTTSVSSSWEDGKEEVILKVSEAKAAMMKVDVSSAAVAVKTAFDGGVAAVANSMRGEKEDIDIVVKYNEQKSKPWRDLQTIRIKNTTGNLVPVNRFGSFNTKPSVGVISHEDGDRFVSVTAEVKRENDRKHTSTWISQQVEGGLKPIQDRHPGLRLVLSGQSEENKELTASALLAMVVVVISIAIILTALFKSFLQPLIVMCAIPFGVIGVINGLIVHYIVSFFIPLRLSMYAFNFMTTMGLVALIGVVINDSLVLVSFINKNRRSGLAIKDALVEASKTRLRPIILTTITTLVGLIPFSYGILGGEPFLQPLGIALIWGLIFATPVTLLILPCIYLLFDGLAQRVYGWFGREYRLPGTLE